MQDEAAALAALAQAGDGGARRSLSVPLVVETGVGSVVGRGALN